MSVQVDRNLRWEHVYECTILDDAVHMIMWYNYIFRLKYFEKYKLHYPGKASVTKHSHPEAQKDEDMRIHKSKVAIVNIITKNWNKGIALEQPAATGRGS